MTGLLLSVALADVFHVSHGGHSFRDVCSILPELGSHEIIVTGDLPDHHHVDCETEELLIRSSTPGVPVTLNCMSVTSGQTTRRDCFEFDDGDITVRDLRLEMPNTNFIGIDMKSSGSLLVEGVEFVGSGRGIRARSDSSSITIRDSLFQGLLTGSDGTIAQIDDTVVLIENSSFLHNTSSSGGLYVRGGSLEVRNSVFSGNLITGGAGGGAIRARELTSLLVVDSLFQGNEYQQGGGSSDGGGALHSSENAQVEIRNSRFCDNLSNARGSAVMLEQGPLTFSGNVVARESADEGALYLFGSAATLAELSHNTFVQFSGASGVVHVQSGQAEHAFGNLFIEQPDNDLRFAVAPTGLVDNAHYGTGHDPISGPFSSAFVFSEHPPPATPGLSCELGDFSPGVAAAVLNAAPGGLNYGALQDVDLDGVEAPVDCDDGDSNVLPGAPELCNGIDDNCDGAIDEGLPLVALFEDADLDGFGGGASTMACGVVPGASSSSNDCDDTDATVHPQAPELCDSVDRNCDQDPFLHAIDAPVWFLDQDLDQFGDPSSSLFSCVQPLDHVPLGHDCNDDDPTSYPGAEEVCDGADNDCDQMVDDVPILPLWYPDLDGDGFGDEAGGAFPGCDPPGDAWSMETMDCDDDNPDIFPGAPELCDHIDNDCSGVADDHYAGPTWYLDVDGDGFGVDTLAVVGCEQPDDYTEHPGDCDDGNELVYPGAHELCDGTDNNCTGSEADADDAFMVFVDTDGDGFGLASAGAVCVLEDHHSTESGDCDDADPQLHPGAAEVCDAIDNDCDGAIDDEDPDVSGPFSVFFPDSDGDGFGTAEGVVQACNAPVGFVSDGTDCNDDDATVRPGAPEICDGIDNDCDFVIELTTGFADVDRDGFGNPNLTVDDCSGVPDDSDCNDEDPSIHPGATEVQGDGIDQDCDPDNEEIGFKVSCSTIAPAAGLFRLFRRR